jgi:hypothetical protein
MAELRPGTVIERRSRDSWVLRHGDAEPISISSEIVLDDKGEPVGYAFFVSSALAKALADAGYSLASLEIDLAELGRRTARRMVVER